MLIFNFNEGTIGLQDKEDSRLEEFIGYIHDNESMQDLINFNDMCESEEDEEE